MIEKTEALVISSRKFGDSSKIINVFSIDYGKLSFLAKGARNQKNKFGASLEPLTHSQFTFYNKPNHELLLLSGSDIIKSYSSLSQHPDHFVIGMMIAESIYTTQDTRMPNRDIFNIFLNSLNKLYLKTTQPFGIFSYFMFRLSEILGFQFEIDQNEFSSRSEVTLNIIDGKIIDNYQIDQKNIFTFSEAEINYFYNVNYGKDAITIEINKKE